MKLALLINGKKKEFTNKPITFKLFRLATEINEKLMDSQKKNMEILKIMKNVKDKEEQEEEISKVEKELEKTKLAESTNEEMDLVIEQIIIPYFGNEFTKDEFEEGLIIDSGVDYINLMYSVLRNIQNNNGDRKDEQSGKKKGQTKA